MTVLRRIVFWLHLLTGAMAGLVILVMTVTGVLLAFEPQIVDVSERHLRTVPLPAPDARRLPLDDLVARARATRNDASPTTVVLRREPGAVVRVAFDRDDVVGVNPFTGDVVGHRSRTHALMHTIEDWHRWLGAKDTLRSVTGAANIAFFFLALSGLYLWWPRTWTRAAVRAVTVFDARLSGRARDFNWHNTAGFWCAAVIVVLTLTGVVMSYQWANDLLYTMTGNTPPPPPGAPRADASPRREGERRRGGPSASLETLAARAEAQLPGWDRIMLRLPQRPGGPLTAFIAQEVSWGPIQRSQLTLDSATGTRRPLGALRHRERGPKAQDLGPLPPHGRGLRCPGTARGRRGLGRGRPARVDRLFARVAALPRLARAHSPRRSRSRCRERCSTRRRPRRRQPIVPRRFRHAPSSPLDPEVRSPGRPPPRARARAHVRHAARLVERLRAGAAGRHPDAARGRARAAPRVHRARVRLVQAAVPDPRDAAVDHRGAAGGDARAGGLQPPRRAAERHRHQPRRRRGRRRAGRQPDAARVQRAQRHLPRRDPRLRLLHARPLQPRGGRGAQGPLVGDVRARLHRRHHQPGLEDADARAELQRHGHRRQRRLLSRHLRSQPAPGECDRGATERHGHGRGRGRPRPDAHPAVRHRAERDARARRSHAAHAQLSPPGGPQHPGLRGPLPPRPSRAGRRQHQLRPARPRPRARHRRHRHPALRARVHRGHPPPQHHALRVLLARGHRVAAPHRGHAHVVHAPQRDPGVTRGHGPRHRRLDHHERHRRDRQVPHRPLQAHARDRASRSAGRIPTCGAGRSTTSRTRR